MTTVPEPILTAEEAQLAEAAKPAADEPPPIPPQESPETLIGAIDDWLHSLRVAFARALDITVLEARLAALNFALIAIVAVASGLLLATAWIALFAAIVAVFHELGLSWSAALLLMALINFALAALGGYAIYRMSNNLLFKAIRKFIVYGLRDKGEQDANVGSAAGNKSAAP